MTAYVYAVRRQDGAIKIGFSRYPNERFLALKATEVLGLKRYENANAARDAEKDLHRKLFRFSLGQEWFRPELEVESTAFCLGMVEAPPAREPSWKNLRTLSVRMPRRLVHKMKVAAARNGLTMQSIARDGAERILAHLAAGGSL